MKYQFADHKTSKALKELGFKEWCLGEYDQVGGFRYCKNVIDEFTGNTISAPLWQQVKIWLYYNHDIDVEHWASRLVKEKKYRWLYNFTGNTKPLNGVGFPSPIEAEEEGIKKAVEHLYALKGDSK